jgi:biotin transport system substrate-specific component
LAPVYAGGTSGLGVLLGPTGGYLFGFLLGAVVAGSIAHSGRGGLVRYIVAGCLALLPIYAVGATWLAISLDLTAVGAVLAGVLPFLPFDVLKAVAAGCVAQALVKSPLGLPATMRGR